MARITIELPDHLAERVNSVAAVRGVALSEIAREAVAKEFASRQPLSFVGVGASGGGDATAERHKDLRRTHFADKTASDV